MNQQLVVRFQDVKDISEEIGLEVRWSNKTLTAQHLYIENRPSPLFVPQPSEHG